MDRVTAVSATVILLVFVSSSLGSVSWVVNGSFEYDGGIGNIENEIPFGWDDVNLPGNKFYGGVFSDWSPDGDYSLSISSNSYMNLDAGDIGTISQWVYFEEDVNDIFFDLLLETDGGSWTSGGERSAVLKIDDDIVWSSNSLGEGDLTGDYVVEVSGIEGYQDMQPHLLSLGLLVNTSGDTYTVYFASWDHLRFDAHCEGYGYLDSDFNHDCFVNFIDYGMFADYWMDEVGNYSMYNLDPNNNIIDGNDLEIFLSEWLGDSYGQEVKVLEFDTNTDGIVNFVDYSMMVKQWDSEGIDYEAFEAFVYEWLETNWMYELQQ